MLSRRDLIFSGALASRLQPDDAPLGGAQRDNDTAIVGELVEVRKAIGELGRMTPSPDLADIRAKQRTFFRANQKFPDFIDIGIAVWERLYDWQITNQQPVKVARTPDGRVVMELMLTTLVLKADMAESQIGIPYDR